MRDLISLTGRRDRWTCSVRYRNGVQPARAKTSFALHKSMINSRPRYPKVSGRIPRVDLGINVNVANIAICYDKLALNRNV